MLVEYYIKVKVLKEEGLDEALFGLSLNKNQPRDKMENVAMKLKDLDYGHNKFLESIYIWLDVTAPRYWWQEADTYRLSTKQSQSTMHTIHKRKLTVLDFEYINLDYLEVLNKQLEIYRKLRRTEDLIILKSMLPEGFLQRRLWVMNFKTLNNIIKQRYNHRLPHWRKFIEEIYEQSKYKKYLFRYGEK